MSNKMIEIAEHFRSAGAKIYYVGGCCRDWIMGREPEDIDICIVGFNNHHQTQAFLSRLKEDGIIDNFTLVYGKFPIWIVETEGVKYEFAMARKEIKSGNKRTEFTVEVNNVSLVDDLYRRDFTVNAIAKDVITGSYYDPYDGIGDILEQWLRPVSEKFKEDALRVIRGARFAARFNLKPSMNFFTYAAELDSSEVSNERVGIELMKLFKTADKPSIFFKILKSVNWLRYHFKEVDDLIGIPQSPIHHPEGDAFTHTMHCIDIAEGWFMRAVMLCHDLGKATTTTIDGIPLSIAVRERKEIERGSNAYKIQSIGHEEASVELTHRMLNRIVFSNHRTVEKIALLVELHMIRNIISQKVVRRTLRRLMNVNLTWNHLVKTCTYDVCGRSPKPCVKPYMMEEFAAELISSGQMIPIVTGKLLVEQLGITDVIEVGIMIKKALELQDRGTLNKDNWFQVLKGVGFKSLTEINYEDVKNTQKSTDDQSRDGQ